MNKQEFIDKLSAALNGRISPAQVQDNVNYYSDYINTQIRMGKSEAQVLEELGDPRLIARTIIAANGQSGDAGTAYREYRSTSSNYGNSSRNSGGYSGQESRTGMPKWLWIVIGILLLAVLLGIVFSVLTFLLPVLVPILVVLFLVKLFRDWLN